MGALDAVPAVTPPGPLAAPRVPPAVPPEADEGPFEPATACPTFPGTPAAELEAEAPGDPLSSVAPLAVADGPLPAVCCRAVVPPPHALARSAVLAMRTAAG